MELIDMRLQDYLQLVASDAPAPGGGSASALCGAQGIGLIAMVAKLTLGKEKFEAYHDVCRTVAAGADELCGKLTEQIDVDTRAYGRIAEAFRLLKQTDEEKAQRKAAIADATLYAAEVPMQTMRLALAGLHCAERLLGHYNTNCASDVGCGIHGLLACVHGAWLNVQINAGGWAQQEQLLRDGSEIAAQAEALAHALLTELQRDIRVEQ